MNIKAYCLYFVTFIILSENVNFVISNSTVTAATNVTTTTDPIPNYENEEIDAQIVMTNANTWMSTVYWSRLREIFVTSNEKYNQINSGPLIQEMNKEYQKFIANLAMNLSQFHSNQFQNNQLKRQINYLVKTQFRGLPTEKYEKTQQVLRKFKELLTAKNICKYYSENCNEHLSYLPNINDIIENSMDQLKLEYYWHEWRDTISKDMRLNYMNYIDLYTQTAILNGHYRPSKTWYHNYDDDNFINELEKAMHELKPLYKELHGHIRYKLRNEFGDKIIPSDGLIPQHIMEKIMLNAWKAKSIFNPPFPNRQLPNIKQKMDQARFTPLTIIDLSARFYNKLGLKDLPETFWLKYSRKFSDDDANCKAQIYYFPPQVALKYCSKIDFKKFLQMHGHMAELHYNYIRGRLPFGLDREACPGFGNAIGESAILAASSPKYLEKIELMGNYTLDKDLSLNRVFRMGIHTIFSIPMYFINEKFWVDSIDNRIPTNKWNCEYWKLQDQYAGVKPPKFRTNEHFDLGQKFYSGIDPDQPNTIKIVSELLGYQFYRAFCIKANQYVPGDPSLPLHNCDYSASHQVGKLIDEMMSLGSTKNWRDIMEIVTGDRKLNAKAILEYYDPLYKWLKSENLKHNAYVGWESEDYCEDNS